MSSPKKRTPSAPASAPKSAAPPAWWPDLLYGGLLAWLAIYLLNLSWRKWPDPIVDVGREFYLPWRLSQGAVLYRDLQHMYGPFSPYFNSLVFRIGGVSLTSLIVANILIYAGILSLLYYFLRAGWGRFAAFVACVAFVGVFSFSHLVGIGNYNFIMPYAHEATHGILLVLLLIWTLRGLLDDGARWKYFCAGLLVGVAILMKPETLLAAGVVSLGAILLSAREHFRTVRAGWAVKILLLLAGGLAPMAVAALLFHLGAGFSWTEALRDVNTGWINVFVYTNALSSPMQKASMGTDNLGGNLLREALAGGLAVGFAGTAAWACRFFPQWGKGAEVLCGIFLVVVALVLAGMVDWLNIGPAIPGMLLCAAALEAWKLWRRPRPATFDEQTAIRVMLWLAGAAFLFRMAFNPRVYHYGFFQAPVATVVGVATLLVAVPDYFELQGPLRKLYQGVIAALVLWATSTVIQQSRIHLELQTFPVGTGGDQFFAFDPEHVDPSGALVEVARQYLAGDPGAHSLLVLPEGVTLNYLLRLPNPTPYYVFDPSQIVNHGTDIMQRLNASPPDRIVLLSRDLTEYGVGKFGESPDHGSAIMDFIMDNYHPVYQQGGDPLDVEHQRGVIVYAHNPTPSKP
jgi:4-amino-4-deoxy-L-arabinose transferase-like glycosyltransferase